MKGRRALPTCSGSNRAKTPRQRLPQLLSLSIYGIKALEAYTLLKEFDYLCIGNNSNMVETIIGIIFIVFVVARVLLGKEDGNDNHSGHRPQPDNLDEEREKYPPSYY